MVITDHVLGIIELESSSPPLSKVSLSAVLVTWGQLGLKILNGKFQEYQIHEF